MAEQKIVFLRLLKEEDLEWARSLHNDPDVICMLTDPHLISEEEQIKWFASLQKSKSMLRMIVEWKGERVGLVRIDQLDYYNQSVRVGLDIHKDFRGQGLSKPVYKELFKHYFEDLGFHRVWLLVAAYNTKAKRIYTELGFKEEGIQREALLKNGTYHNYVVMGLLREEYVQLYC